MTYLEASGEIKGIVGAGGKLGGSLNENELIEFNIGIGPASLTGGREFGGTGGAQQGRWYGNVDIEAGVAGSVGFMTFTTAWARWPKQVR